MNKLSEDEVDQTCTNKEKIIFYWNIIKIKKGITKDKKDIYIIAQCSTALCSNQELKNYCQANHVKVYDEALTSFLIENTYEGPSLKKILKLETSFQTNEALLTKLIISKTSTHAKFLSEVNKWIAAMNVKNF